MNRQTRRNLKRKGASPPDLSKALSSLESLQQLSELSQKLGPYLENIEQLSQQLRETTDSLQRAEAELIEQRQIFLNLIAIGMGISIEQVLSMEAQIRESIKNADATTGAEKDGKEAQKDPSPETAGRLEETPTEDDSKGSGEPGPAT